jgi:hypothetical protein
MLAGLFDECEHEFGWGFDGGGAVSERGFPVLNEVEGIAVCLIEHHLPGVDGPAF